MAPSSNTSFRQVVIKVSDDHVIDSPDHVLDVIGRAKWRAITTHVDGAQLRPAYGSVSTEQLEELRRLALVADPGFAASRLTNYYVLSYPDGVLSPVHDAQLRNDLRAIDAVVSAQDMGRRRRPLSPVLELALAAEIEPYDPQRLVQTYLDRAPQAEDDEGGIDARHAWRVDGGPGDRVKVCDVESGWVFEHEALAAKNIPCHGRSTEFFGHGTSVLGILAGGGDPQSALVLPRRPEDHDRLIGIVPNASIVTASVFQQPNVRNVGDALLSLALNNPFNLEAGDVILIEDQASVLNRNAPVEAIQDVFEVIAQITRGKQFVVVESAANGDVSLDRPEFEWSGTGRHPFDVQHPRFADSQAILVAAATRRRTRDGDSNFGSRIDCFARGSDLATCGDGVNSRSPTTYISNFGNTSGATAVVAGAAASVQSMLRSAGRRPLTGIEMRRLLTHPANSTPAANAVTGIGRMPDLRRLAEGLGLRADS